ncbi:imidazole glycerol phosphate synthase subunit HisH [Vibrio coralliilyticus]|uniref:imidazole glycerol phosphate synthase subunit HisH n=1 Tax=Vibrio coralliilyticus TaxID=190893 RepID=UPI0017F8703C|nr:imidazole glycerol phosphate synthase subunit HisH [Vibrio coralliilyticus]NUW68978.1 imidazole glycerol phosphate synthase subunit HisH [Vibrio coralliilyticus]
MITIAIIDYDVGNIQSIKSAFEKVGAFAKVTREPREILDADGVVLPGVGAFAHGMEKLTHYKLDLVLKEIAANGTPLLGICLGMQMLFSTSSEFGSSEGLGIIPGKVVKLPLLDENYQKLPHVSWSELENRKQINWSNTILDSINEGEDMYFVHSFHASPQDVHHILSETQYSGNTFCSTVRKDNVFGCQYHPEKSSVEGLKIIENFAKICGRRKNVRKT